MKQTYKSSIKPRIIYYFFSTISKHKKNYVNSAGGDGPVRRGNKRYSRM